MGTHTKNKSGMENTSNRNHVRRYFLAIVALCVYKVRDARAHIHVQHDAQ